jgi:hypothetical protein
MLTKTKNELGRWVYSFGEEIKPPKKETTTLDFEAITKTLSAMKKWLATGRCFGCGRIRKGSRKP